MPHVYVYAGAGCDDHTQMDDELSEITRYLLRFSPDALIVVDDASRIRFANETVALLFGHDPRSLVGQPLEMLVPERLRARHREHLAAYMRAPKNREMGARIADLYARRADGSEFAAGIRLAPFSIGGRRFVAAAIRDNSERQQINEALVAAREEADRANRAKSRFLATASHDLRQPLQTIRLLNAALLKVVQEADLRKLLDQQSQAIESMIRLLNALLDISRLESGAIEPRSVEVPLRELLEQLRGEFASIASARQLELDIHGPDVVVCTDRILFYQMLQNLLGNALKYTDRGAVRLRCSTGPEALTIAIEDTGIGIPADKLEHIFDEYYQVDTQGAPRMGVGLGLAIVKEVSRLLGFPVQISSTLGSGTQARITVPNRFLRAAPAERAPSVALGDAIAASSRRPRVLLVEDNEGVRVATELFLKLEGYETLSAPSYAEAQRLFSGTSAGEVVIADYHLDGQHSGLDLLKAVRERAGREVPGVILSGDLPSVLRSVRTPVASCRFLSKPVDTGALIAAIQELTGTSAAAV